MAQPKPAAGMLPDLYPTTLETELSLPYLSSPSPTPPTHMHELSPLQPPGAPAPAPGGRTKLRKFKVSEFTTGQCLTLVSRASVLSRTSSTMLSSEGGSTTPSRSSAGLYAPDRNFGFDAACDVVNPPRNYGRRKSFQALPPTYVQKLPVETVCPALKSPREDEVAEMLELPKARVVQRRKSLGTGVVAAPPSPMAHPAARRQRAKAPTREVEILSMEDYSTRFKRIKTLGKGTQGTVDLCVDLQQQDRKVVLKTANDSCPSAKKDLLREGMMLQRIEHPNVVTLLGMSLNPDNPLLVLELCGPMSLEDYITHNGAQGVKDAALILLQLVEVLEMLHGQGIVHHDIKPANILLNAGRPGETPVVKLCDFGLAKMRADKLPGDVILSRGCGTECYLPYEVFDPMVKNYDAKKVDVWSFGIILYNLLTCCYPWRSPKPKTRAYQVFREGAALFYDQMETVTKGELPVPPEVRQMLQAVLHHDPKQRPSFSEFHLMRFFVAHTTKK